MKKLLIALLPVLDALLVPLVYPAAWLLKSVRRAGVHRLRLSRKVLTAVGMFPIRDHYYEPQFDMSEAKRPFSSERVLPGIDWNVPEQLALLDQFTRSKELLDLPIEKTGDLVFHLKNTLFESGDAEFWYQLIRLKKPPRIYEIGSGHSTLMAIRAIEKNREEDPGYSCTHVCVEPYEMPWLERTRITVIRKKVEDMDVAFFADLDENDILFIDSSHMIRPEGDVLFEYLELLPTLKRGVIVHIHDIFSPRNYLKTWLMDEVRFWNEQYLLEAFLSHNRDWKVIGAVNYLRHNHFDRLKAVAPFLTQDREPGSFYLQRL